MSNQPLSERTLEEEVIKRLEELEERTYGHTDNVEDMAEQVMYIVGKAETTNTATKRAIAQEAINLLEMFRFE